MTNSNNNEQYDPSTLLREMANSLEFSPSAKVAVITLKGDQLELGTVNATRPEIIALLETAKTQEIQNIL